MSDKKTVGKGGDIDVKGIDNKQRRLLVGGSLTGVAAAVWHKPLINAIALPAHAQTSAPATMAFFGAGAPAPKGVASSVLEVLIPEAHAGDVATEVESVMASIVQNELDGTDYTVSILVDLGNNLSREFEKVQLLFSGSLTLGVQGELAASEDPCDIANTLFRGSVPALNVTLESVTDEQAVLTGGNSFIEEDTVSIPAGTGSLPSAMCMEVQRAEAFASVGFIADAQGKQNSNSSVEGIAESILNTIIPEASAGNVAELDSFSASALLTDADNDEYMVVVQNENRGIRWSGSVEIEDGRSQLTVLQLDPRVTCNETSSDDAEISVMLSEGLRVVTRPLINAPSSMSLVLEVPEFGIFENLPENDTPLAIPQSCQDAN